MKGLHGLGLVLLEQLGQNILESVLANSDSVEVSVVQKKGAGWRKNDKHVMNVFAVWWGLNQFWRKILCGRNCMNSAKEQQHNFKRNSWGMPFFHHILFGPQWQYFLVNFLWNSDAFLLHFYWNSSEFLLLLLHFLQFLCISEKIWGISYEFLMRFLCMIFLCNSYAVFTAYTFLAKVYETLKLHKNCIRSA